MVLDPQPLVLLLDPKAKSLGLLPPKVKLLNVTVCVPVLVI